MIEENLIPEADESEKINFFSEDTDFSISDTDTPSIRKWIHQVIHVEQQELIALNFIFCSDTYLHQINLEYLNHDTLTDVITFPYSTSPKIEGDIFISIDRIKENASLFKTSFKQELHRIMIHGVLHLCGYTDKDKESKVKMSHKENEALELLNA